jgi:hypothetical protein
MINRPHLRPYKLTDIEAICDAVEKYLPELPHYKDITVAKDRLSYLLRHNFGNSGYFQCWVLELDGELVGGVAGYCTQGMVTWDLIANDVFLYLVESQRTLRNVGLLMDVYKKWALARGAVLITATTTGGYKPEKFDILMRRAGYTYVGNLYHLRTDEAFLSKQLSKLKEEGINNVQS